MAPLSDFELATGYILGSVARGLICGLVTFFGILFFVPLAVFSYSALFFYSLMGCMMMGSMGVMVGIWADKWDQQQGITNFIVLPLTFLAGPFTQNVSNPIGSFFAIVILILLCILYLEKSNNKAIL